MNATDPVLAGLAGLAPTDTPDLTDRLFDAWLTADSLLGPVRVASTRDGISFLRTTAEFSEDDFRAAYRRRVGRPLRPTDAVPDGLEAALHGEATAAPRLDLLGLTDFQRDVLAATRTIPAGETRPYAWVAAEVGRPRAVRAAGTVLATNPVPLLIPCHRVVPSATGAGAGIGRYIFGVSAKQRLLAAEGAAIATAPAPEEGPAR
ncbi:methylated-DNA--[protein]-cysteine S-methyltransferase [Actinomycetospora sp. TBRC 11914]|uniref:methylated-DNA--[protein]-cysteine S-methyltransferase n=1 Tax=Actinomycetospora sp. TBRC 11914 TaxID=2729387 RepID=UPI00145D7B20|nr:MGMT family protein [Actinomycetospora sp. TBRC 11914]NMO88545.1 MGMT family protein [Actinomycetospora sp. TBRC 11914]